MKQLRLASIFLSVFLFLITASADFFEVVYTGSRPLPSWLKLGPDKKIRNKDLFERLHRLGYTDWHFDNAILASRYQTAEDARQKDNFREFGDMKKSAKDGMGYRWARYGVGFAPIAAIAGAAGMMGSEGVQASEVRESSASESGLAANPAQVSTETREIKPQQSTGAARFVRPAQESKKIDQRR